MKRTQVLPPIVGKHRSGFCHSGFDTKCRGAVHNGNGQVIKCPCGCHENLEPLCLICGHKDLDHQFDPVENEAEINPQTWECIDKSECDRRMEVRRSGSSVYQRIVEAQEKARERGGSKPPRTPREVTPKTGACLCCGETTKGGLFLPGHDARLVSRLIQDIAAASPADRDAMIAKGRAALATASDALKGKFEKRLAS